MTILFTSDQKMERQQSRQKQLQEQENVYGSMSILGDSILEYDLANISFVTRNKPQKQQNKNKEVLEREHLRQLQLQEQEALFEHMDLLGETILEFSPLQLDTSSYNSIEHEQDRSEVYTIISNSPEKTPETSSGSRRISKYLSPEQVAQLAKIRKKRYEQLEQEYSDENLLEESVPSAVKNTYSFRQPNARLKSPRELLFTKSIVNVHKNKDNHSKSLPLPVMNFPPRNWPTPNAPEIRQDLNKLRHEQRQYFLSMQQAQAQQKFQNLDENQDQIQSVLQERDFRSTQKQKVNLRQDQNKHQGNLNNTDDEGSLSLEEDRHKLMKYLYIILCVQWSLITGIVALFNYHKPSSDWLEKTGDWTWLYILCILNGVVISFIIFPATRNIFPINLMMFTLFILLVAFMFSFVVIFYPNNAVLLALGCTCVISLVLALFFCQTSYNFTIYCGLSLCSIVILFVLGIFYLLIDLIILEIVYAAVGVFIYSIYLVCNTRAILEGRSKFQIESDNYILGAIHLNLNFIFITVEKLQCS